MHLNKVLNKMRKNPEMKTLVKEGIDYLLENVVSLPSKKFK